MFKLLVFNDLVKVRTLYSLNHIFWKPFKLPIMKQKQKKLLELIFFFELTQKSNKKYNVTFFFKPDNKLTYINGSLVDDSINSDQTLSAIVIFMKLLKKIKCINFLFNIYNVKFLSHYTKVLILLFDEFNILNFKDTNIIFSKPNYYELYTQKKKIKSIKKSRKKMLYIQRSKVKVL